MEKLVERLLSNNLIKEEYNHFYSLDKYELSEYKSKIIKKIDEAKQTLLNLGNAINDLAIKHSKGLQIGASSFDTDDLVGYAGKLQSLLYDINTFDDKLADAIEIHSDKDVNKARDKLDKLCTSYNFAKYYKK
jgi:hypothetical protein